jgi:hypothetical protein
MRQDTSSFANFLSNSEGLYPKVLASFSTITEAISLTTFSEKSFASGGFFAKNFFIGLMTYFLRSP